MNTRKEQSIALLSLALSFLVNACAPVGPDFVKPDANEIKDWTAQSREDFLFEAQDKVEWWQVFDDTVLNNLVKLAHQHNNNVRLAGLRVLEARAILGIATGSMYPQSQAMFGEAIAVQASESNANTGGGGDLQFTQYSLGVGASWEVDFWGRFRRGIEAADANLLATSANYDDVMVLVIAGVADTYMIIRSTEEQLRLARDSLELQQRSYEIVDVLFRNGSTSELDRLQAKTLLLGTKATIPGLEITLQQSKNALSVLLGIAPSRLEHVFKGDGTPPDVPDTLSVGLPADLLRQRPVVRRAELQALAQNALVGVAEANLYPSFSLNGFLGVSSTDVKTGNAIIDDMYSNDSEA